MAGGVTEEGFLIGPMEVDIAVPGIFVGGVESAQAKDSGENQIFSGGRGVGVFQGVNFAGWNASAQDGAWGEVVTDFFGDLEASGGSFEAARLEADAKFRGADGKGDQDFSIAVDGGGLGGDGDSDGKSCRGGAGGFFALHSAPKQA